MQVTSIVGAILRSSRITRSSFDSSQQVQLLICHFPSLLITSWEQLVDWEDCNMSIASDIINGLEPEIMGLYKLNTILLR